MLKLKNFHLNDFSIFLLCTFFPSHHMKVEYLQKYAESEEIVASSFGIIQITRTALLRVRRERKLNFRFDFFFLL